MIARGFKSVVWVAAVGGAALGCYMLSLQVATERADLAKVERQIIATKQQIRSLQTELGTRGRLSQLEQWNADVLALSAPASAQFLQDEFTLARLDRREPTIADQVEVRMASADTVSPPVPVQAHAPPPAPVREPKAAPEAEPALPAAPQIQSATVHRASLTVTAPTAVAAPAPRAVKPAKPAKPARLGDDKLAREIAAAERAEKSGKGSAGTR
jgi:hypothetical protein